MKIVEANMKYVVYDGMSDAYDRKFDDGKFVYLKKGVVTAVSEEIFSVLKDCKRTHRISEVIALDNLSKKNLEKI